MWLFLAAWIYMFVLVNWVTADFWPLKFHESIVFTPYFQTLGKTQASELFRIYLDISIWETNSENGAIWAKTTAHDVMLTLSEKQQENMHSHSLEMRTRI